MLRCPPSPLLSRGVLVVVSSEGRWRDESRRQLLFLACSCGGARPLLTLGLLRGGSVSMKWSFDMIFLRFLLPCRALFIRWLLSLWRKDSDYACNGLLRAGQEPVRQPALMTVIHGGRPPRFP